MEQIADLLERARQAAQQGQMEEARALVGEALALQPSSAAAWALRAQLAHDPWEARHAWERVLALEPGHPEAEAFLHPPSPPPPAPPPTVPAPRARIPMPSRAVWLSLGQRLAFAAIVLLAVMLLAFLGLELARGTAFRPALSHAASETVGYVGLLARGELDATVPGQPRQQVVPMTQMIRDSAINTLGLLGVSMLLAAGVGVTLGGLAALSRNGGCSLALIVASLVGISVPSFVAAVLLQDALLRGVRLTDSPPLVPLGGFGWDRHLVLPALVLAARPIAQIARVTFLSLRDVLAQDFVRTAHGKGLAPSLVMRRHVLRNAAIPILTTLGLSLRFSLSSLPVVELFFSWPGMGLLLLRAIAQQDDALTVGLLLCLGLLFILVNALLEGIYRLIDPRLRERARATPFRAGSLRGLVRSLTALLADNPLRRWLRRRRAQPEPSPFRAMLAQRGEALPEPGAARGQRWRTWRRATLQNLPFVLGTLLVLGLAVVFFFGPQLAPDSPYTTRLVAKVDGEFSVPPFKPGADFPWGTDFLGRDLQSLVLAGAQQTLMLAGLTVVGRMLLGIVLGALAGWLRGSWLDRGLLGLAEIIAAFPGLLLAMTFILALGIRQGMRPFVVALTLVGWGEVMQFVRSQVLAIRPRPWIESAVAVGLTTPRIVVGHVLPNLLPTLISLAALEMGAVLMLLGELGFIGIFIGGGIVTEGYGHYSDVPEWGALLANIRLYIRSYPWMALYPSLAFFLAILAFNLFGEGMRRLVDDVGVSLTRWLNRYAFAVAAVVVVALFWARDYTGSAAFYRRQASLFEGDRAFSHVQALAAPTMEGRAVGTQGVDAAADWIGEQFGALSLQKAGEDSTFFQTRTRAWQSLDAPPLLSIEDGGEPLRYHEDYVEMAGIFRNGGRRAARCGC